MSVDRLARYGAVAPAGRVGVLFLGHDGIDWQALKAATISQLGLPVQATAFAALVGLYDSHKKTQPGSMLRNHDRDNTAVQAINHPWFGAAEILPERLLAGLTAAFASSFFAPGFDPASQSQTCVLRHCSAMFWNPDQARERLGFILDLSADLHIVTVFDAGPAAVARFVQQTRWKAKDSENTLRSTETCFRAMLAARPDRVTQCDMTDLEPSLARLQEKLDALRSLS